LILLKNPAFNRTTRSRAFGHAESGIGEADLQAASFTLRRP